MDGEELEDENAYQAQDDEFLLIDYKMFQRYYRGANRPRQCNACSVRHGRYTHNRRQG